MYCLANYKYKQKKGGKDVQKKNNNVLSIINNAPIEYGSADLIIYISIITTLYNNAIEMHNCTNQSSLME